MARLRPASLSSVEDINEAANALARRCKVMRRLYRDNGAPPQRDLRPDFSGLVQIICGQQVSAASAAAIGRRVAAGLNTVDAATVLGASAERLAGLGLSRPKIRTLKTLAQAVDDGALNIEALNRASDDKVADTLTTLHGIGPWTADIYLLFALKRADAFPAGDLALQLAAGRLFADGDRLSALELLALAESWRPYRAIAARMLWDDYGRQKRSKNATAQQAIDPKPSQRRKALK